MDSIRNESVRGTAAHAGCVFGYKAAEARLRWFAHVQRRDREYAGWVGGRRSGGGAERILMEEYWACA